MNITISNDKKKILWNNFPIYIYIYNKKTSRRAFFEISKNTEDFVKKKNKN